MSAVRVARAATGRDRVVKFEGCYHGHADGFLVQAGSGALTLGVGTAPPRPLTALSETIFTSFGTHFEFGKNEKGEVTHLILIAAEGNLRGDRKR